MKKHVKKLTVGVLAAVVLLMGACAPKAKTLTVPELLENIPLLIKTTVWCNENLGERIALTQHRLVMPPERVLFTTSLCAMVPLKECGKKEKK